MSKESSEQPQYVTLADYRWLQERVDRAERKMRMILDMLVAKKVITEAEAKIFSETKTNDEELIKWYLETLSKK